MLQEKKTESVSIAMFKYTHVSIIAVDCELASILFSFTTDKLFGAFVINVVTFLKVYSRIKP